MKPKEKKCGHFSFVLGMRLILAALIGFGAPVLWAQQAVLPPGDGYQVPYGYPPSAITPGPTPYLGAPTYNPNVPSYLLYPPQSRYFQGMMMPQQPPQPGVSFYGPQRASPSLLKSCQYTIPRTPPSSPAAPEAPSTATPVEGPLLGSGGGLAAQALRQIAGEQPMEAAKDVPQNKLPGQGRDKNVSSESFVPEPFSPIEASFNLPLFAGQPAPRLRQFGYAVFSNPVSTFAPVVNVPVGPDYILGPGDNLQIRVWGTTEGAIVQSVNQNGEINLPNVGPVRVWGLTFQDAGELIRQQLSLYYRGLKTSITMGRIRTITVYVIGEVCQPGSYTLSSLSMLTHALFAAGGPVKLGSLRNVTLKRNHHTLGTIDLYNFLLYGDRGRDFRLQSGDTIFVPPTGPVVAIAGEVKRPAIYELNGTTRISDLIEMAGGTTPRSYLKRVQVIRTKADSREIIDLDLTASETNGNSSDIALRDGDLVTISPTDPRIYNTVRLAGAVKYPGEYEYKPGMRLSQLIREDAVLPEAYLERIEIARVKDNLTAEILDINLKQAWAGDEDQNVLLQELDHITIRSEYRKPWVVTLEGEVKRPGTYTIERGERLSSVLKRAGGFTRKAFLKGAVFKRESVKVTENKKLLEFMRDQKKRFLAEASQLSKSALGTSLSAREAQIRQSVLTQRMELLELLAAEINLGRVIVHLDEPEQLVGTPNNLILQDGDTLRIPPKPATVMVIGSVRNPTAILYEEGESVEYYLNRAGGLSKEAAKKEVYLLKVDGSAVAGFMKLRDIDPGDVVVVPPSTKAKMELLALVRDLAGILGQVGSATISILGIAAIAR